MGQGIKMCRPVFILSHAAMRHWCLLFLIFAVTGCSEKPQTMQVAGGDAARDDRATALHSAHELRLANAQLLRHVGVRALLEQDAAQDRRLRLKVLRGDLAEVIVQVRPKSVFSLEV